MRTAGIMRSLDLVISVDSMPAHLAGALGVPTWLLLHADPDWRWMRVREHSPWYPSMRLFRQPAPGAWEPVVARVIGELEKLRDRSARPAAALH
jgi:ADP-heptose:LPS heptosyltransferase